MYIGEKMHLLKNDMFPFQTPVHQNVGIFGNKAIKRVIVTDIIMGGGNLIECI